MVPVKLQQSCHITNYTIDYNYVSNWNMKLFIAVFKDPFVAQSKLDHYRCRSAYKLIQIDDKYKFLKKKSLVVSQSVL